ncbi:MAG TPA: CvpA family protein [Persephonella sp.]|uniref:CvpA family protein n=1 Tax=Persephonella marina (strain DSM 14350 / EX-H1) TaxID=123214 RepID=C0QTC0_PERMH|nr:MULTISPECIES: CvpA family protein [Persephonella]ACO03923.1 CvpA family protein [Persephonella marina EX-H1]HCB70446.1 CvpA family protein [Persephonella sp.]
MLDIILLLFFIYLVIAGLFNGFTQIFIKGLGFLTAGYLGFSFTKDLSAYLSRYFNAEKVILDFVAFALIFILVFSVFLLINSIVKKELKSRKKLSIMDKLTGAIAGILIFVICVYMIKEFSKKNETLRELSSKSRIVKLFSWER